MVHCFPRNGRKHYGTGSSRLRHDRRRLAHVGVTSGPTADWISHQISEAFPRDTAPSYLVRDRGGAYGEMFSRRLGAMGFRVAPQLLDRLGRMDMSSARLDRFEESA